MRTYVNSTFDVHTQFVSAKIIHYMTLILNQNKCIENEMEALSNFGLFIHIFKF